MSKRRKDKRREDRTGEGNAMQCMAIGGNASEYEFDTITVINSLRGEEEGQQKERKGKERKREPKQRKAKSRRQSEEGPLAWHDSNSSH